MEFMVILRDSFLPATLRHGRSQRTIGEIKMGKAKQVKKKKKPK
jgi:hypothetical protein